jgi:hypothetical protein
VSFDNPYAAPGAHVADQGAPVPAEILKKIKSAWVAGCISGSVTLIVTLLAISGTSILNYSAWELFDVALIFGLAFGIYKKSRACAVLMLIYFIASKILIAIETGKAPGIVLALIFVYYYWQGVAGTFAYHKLKAAQLNVAVGHV